MTVLHAPGSDASSVTAQAGELAAPPPAGDVDHPRVVWASEAGRIRGVWWPRERNITRELGVLLAAADAFLGAPLSRVSLNPVGWDHQPRRLYSGSRVLRLAWFDSLDPATVAIGATPLERRILCLVPSEWSLAAGERLFRALPAMTSWPDEPAELLARGNSGDPGGTP